MVDLPIPCVFLAPNGKMYWLFVKQGACRDGTIIGCATPHTDALSQEHQFTHVYFENEGELAEAGFEGHRAASVKEDVFEDRLGTQPMMSGARTTMLVEVATQTRRSAPRISAPAAA